MSAVSALQHVHVPVAGEIGNPEECKSSCAYLSYLPNTVSTHSPTRETKDQEDVDTDRDTLTDINSGDRTLKESPRSRNRKGEYDEAILRVLCRTQRLNGEFHSAVPISHQDIGHLVECSTRTVKRAILRLEKEYGDRIRVRHGKGTELRYWIHSSLWPEDMEPLVPKARPLGGGIRKVSDTSSHAPIHEFRRGFQKTTEDSSQTHSSYSGDGGYGHFVMPKGSHCEEGHFHWEGEGWLPGDPCEACERHRGSSELLTPENDEYTDETRPSWLTYYYDQASQARQARQAREELLKGFLPRS